MQSSSLEMHTLVFFNRCPEEEGKIFKDCINFTVFTQILSSLSWDEVIDFSNFREVKYELIELKVY